MMRVMGNSKLPQWALREARRDHYLDRSPLQPDLAEEERFLESQLKIAGYATGTKIEYKGKNAALRRFSRFTTVFPVGQLLGGSSYVAFGAGWGNRELLPRVSTLRHEMTHVRQIEGMGPWMFTTRYLLRQPWRWALEVQAYRLSLAVYKMAGVSDDKLRDKARRIAQSIRESYSLGAIAPDEIERKTRQALLTEI